MSSAISLLRRSRSSRESVVSADEMPSDVDDDALAQRGGVHRDVEELRARGRRSRPGGPASSALRTARAAPCGLSAGSSSGVRGVPSVLPSEETSTPGAGSLLFGARTTCATRSARVVKRSCELAERLRPPPNAGFASRDRHAFVDGARNLPVARDEDVGLAAEDARDVAVGDADLALSAVEDDA